VSAAQRALSREKISAGIGAWLSSFTLGVTEVAERLEVPWFTLSYADSITERGFKYTFQTIPVSSVQAEQALDLVVDLAKRNKQTLRKAAIIGDNTAATVFFFKPLREKLLKAKGIEIVVDEIWTPPLADATAIVQKVRSTQPDIVFYGATNFPDSIQVLQKVKEFRPEGADPGGGRLAGNAGVRQDGGQGAARQHHDRDRRPPAQGPGGSGQSASRSARVSRS